MKLPIRFFGIGLLTAAIIFAISLYFFNDREVNLEELSLEDISSYLESEGYHVITQEQYITLAVKEREEQQKSNDEVSEKEENTEEKENDKEKDKASDENEKDDAKDSKEEDQDKDKEKEDQKEEDSDKKDEKKVYKYTLTVVPNMLGPDVGKLLEENKIIKNAADFAKYLEDNNYSRYIQLGDHKLTSEMTHYEIAEKITSN